MSEQHVITITRGYALKESCPCVTSHVRLSRSCAFWAPQKRSPAVAFWWTPRPPACYRSVKMLGRYVPVRAQVVHVPAFSVHADQTELLDWLRTAPQPPEMTFVVHGEHTAAEAFRKTIEATLGWPVAVPRYLEQVRLIRRSDVPS
jgi:Cft2 family RNA processing exonuclease